MPLVPVRLAVALAAVALAVLSAPDARADPSITRIGWWTRSPSAAAPEGGVVVGAAADGPESVAAIEVDLDGGIADVAIALAEAGGSLQDVASILVCVTDEPWLPVDGGDLADAPEPDCEDGVPMAREDATWRADVGPLVGDRAGPVTLLLVPSPSPTPIPGALVPFEVELARPVLAAASAPTTSPPAGSPPPSSTPRSTVTTRVAVLPPPAVAAPATTVVAAPDAAPSAPTASALGTEDVRRIWRWGLWLRIVVAGTVAGTVAGFARWKLVTRWRPTAP